jgi:hypothetical protein
MRYMLLIYGTDAAWDANGREECYHESTQLAHDLKASGKYLGASPLQGLDTATSVRVRDGKRLVTDGPFAETHEYLGGYYVVDVENLDEAIAIAERIPGARVGTVEIRPIHPLPDLPE